MSFGLITSRIEAALADALGSAAALSIGDGGREVVRFVSGASRRVPDRGWPIDERARFDVASLTKPMSTAAIAMVLVGEGRLALDAPVRDYLPDAQTRGTVAQVLGHAAGCAAHVEFFRRLAAAPPADPRAALVTMAAAEPTTDPGIATVYSDLGYLQLGAIVERAAGMPLERAFAELVAGPLGLAHSAFGPIDPALAVATEIDARGLVCGRVHDENAYFGGEVCGHAGLFSTIGDVATFASAIVSTIAGTPRGRLRTDVVNRFATTSAAPSSWRLGWDTPATTPGISHAGDRWPRTGSMGHLGFTGTSMWLDFARRRWVVLLTNRVHPTRGGSSAEGIKALRRAVNDLAVDLLDGT